jgi:hypothetical protein
MRMGHTFDLKRMLCCMHTAMEAHTEQSFTMFWMMSDGRSGDVGIRLLGRFQVNEEDTEPRDGWAFGSVNGVVCESNGDEVARGK